MVHLARAAKPPAPARPTRSGPRGPASAPQVGQAGTGGSPPDALPKPPGRAVPGRRSPRRDPARGAARQPACPAPTGRGSRPRPRARRSARRVPGPRQAPACSSLSFPRTHRSESGGRGEADRGCGSPSRKATPFLPPKGATETVQRFHGPKPRPLWSLGYGSQGWSFPAPPMWGSGEGGPGVSAPHRTKEEATEGARASGYLGPRLAPRLRPSRPRQRCSRPSSFPQPPAAPHQPRVSSRRTRALWRGPVEPSRRPASSRPRPRCCGLRGGARSARLRTALWEVWFSMTSRGTAPAPAPTRSPRSLTVGGGVFFYPTAKVSLPEAGRSGPRGRPENTFLGRPPRKCLRSFPFLYFFGSSVSALLLEVESQGL